ncbi:ATP-binding cassette domain-containing protein [Mycoplasmopsis verecunda]|uniref:Simple sugar transport system ATP-binding protein n=1 Tax=Mycoplasmopsis verecunda TaxID=171291 RepID=A0A1T4L2Y6_9BACT|nr:ATP-binding cassette domain-containing protein [Mycoplasmopsis verecunda]WPB54452.1 ATP-binding cassette domain-containing protein [Mycoplasmopsis verecunda]SJZ49074.1 simple sugar transport system ATP-binding protein [Mycoplasmopsis verecunda]
MQNNKDNAIEFINISKSFGSIKANQNISFDVKKGTIHALIGENGAGKSTLMSILFGLYEPDEGIIKVNNKEVLIKGPNDANKLGIGMVHQHFKLVDVYTNLENIVLGDEDYRKYSRVIDYKQAIKKIKTIQETFELHFDLNRLTGKETVATQQKVEIMKMLYRDSEILIFDEPTAVLTDQEIQGLLNTFKLFRDQGKTILFISHKLAEIKEVADNATVLRYGKVTGNFKVADVSIEEMANRMVGGEIEIARNEYTDTSNNPVIFKLENITTNGEKPLKNVSLDIREGEIVAIAGVEGNGQSDLEKVVAGMIKPITGDVLFKKTDLVKSRYESVSKEQKIKNISLTLFTILFVYISIILYSIPASTVDRSAIFMILGICFDLFAVTSLVVLINSLYGSKIRKYIISHREPMKKEFSKKAKKWLKTISIIMLVVNILIFGLSFTQMDTWQYVSIAALVISFISVSTGLTVARKSLKQLFAKNNENRVRNILTTISLTVTFIMTIVSLAVFMWPTALVALLLLLISYLVFFATTTPEKEKVEDFDDSFIKLNNLSVYEISKLGLSFIPSDRHKHGLVLDYSIKNNTVLRRLWDKTYQSFGIFKNKNITKENNEIIEKYDVRGARKGSSMARSLSGGNQQKFIVGREMNAPHDFILILQPTRGLDVGAIKNIHERILEEKKQGKAILLISYELDEVLALADRIAVINTGEILTVKEAKNLSRTEIGMYMAHKEKGGE